MRAQVDTVDFEANGAEDFAVAARELGAVAQQYGKLLVVRAVPTPEDSHNGGLIVRIGRQLCFQKFPRVSDFGKGLQILHACFCRLRGCHPALEKKSFTTLRTLFTAAALARVHNRKCQLLVPQGVNESAAHLYVFLQFFDQEKTHPALFDRIRSAPAEETVCGLECQVVRYTRRQDPTLGVPSQVLHEPALDVYYFKDVVMFFERLQPIFHACDISIAHGHATERVHVKPRGLVDLAAVISVLGLYQLERSDHTEILTAQMIDMALDCVGSLLERGLCLLGLHEQLLLFVELGHVVFFYALDQSDARQLFLG